MKKMKIDRAKFLQEGYLVLREVVPADRLVSLRGMGPVANFALRKTIEDRVDPRKI